MCVRAAARAGARTGVHGVQRISMPVIGTPVLCSASVCTGKIQANSITINTNTYRLSYVCTEDNLRTHICARAPVKHRASCVALAVRNILNIHTNISITQIICCLKRTKKHKDKKSNKKDMNTKKKRKDKEKVDNKKTNSIKLWGCPD